jgi:hypothetical protein
MEEAFEVEQRGGDDICDGVDGGGAVGLSLTLAPSMIDQCLGFVGHCVGTVNISSRAPRMPLLYGAVREGVHCHKNGRRPRSGCVMEIFHNQEIIFLTFSSLIFISQS